MPPVLTYIYFCILIPTRNTVTKSSHTAFLVTRQLYVATKLSIHFMHMSPVAVRIYGRNWDGLWSAVVRSSTFQPWFSIAVLRHVSQLQRRRRIIHPSAHIARRRPAPTEKKHPDPPFNNTLEFHAAPHLATKLAPGHRISYPRYR